MNKRHSGTAATIGLMVLMMLILDDACNRMKGAKGARAPVALRAMHTYVRSMYRVCTSHKWSWLSFRTAKYSNTAWVSINQRLNLFHARTSGLHFRCFDFELTYFSEHLMVFCAATRTLDMQVSRLRASFALKSISCAYEVEL
jgi:hypothetical protein